MKLAEALSLRAELKNKINALGPRIRESAKIQEGDEPVEDVDELRKELDEVMTVEQVAEYLGIKPKTVHNKVCNGELPHRKKFGRIYFSKQEITKYCLES